MFDGELKSLASAPKWNNNSLALQSLHHTLQSVRATFPLGIIVAMLKQKYNYKLSSKANDERESAPCNNKQLPGRSSGQLLERICLALWDCNP
jgi:hypothetical protein